MTATIESTPDLTPGEQRAVAAEAVVSAALAAVAAARAAVDEAVAADAAESTPQTRSAAAKARNRQASSQSRLIAAEEAFQRELDRLDDGDQRAAAFERRQELAEADELRGRIRSALQTTGTLAGLFAALAAVSARASLPQVSATTLNALGDLGASARILSGRLDNEGWAKSPNNRSEVTR